MTKKYSIQTENDKVVSVEVDGVSYTDPEDIPDKFDRKKIKTLIARTTNPDFDDTFDEEFARVSGIGTERLNTILALLTAITVVLTMSVVGIMLVSALLILPAVTALQLARSFRGAMLIAACVSLIAVIGGIFLSLFLNLPTGATIVMTGIVIFLAALALRMMRQHGHAVHISRP